ncbi:hypothetical protein LACWKB8_1026 [Lactobacillus sp. wkB8]|nr:hypothetical protein LACWKB8_1026 [Lactobacillus sp. wkB8]
MVIKKALNSSIQSFFILSAKDFYNGTCYFFGSSLVLLLY